MLGKGAILTVFGFMLAFSIYQAKLSSAISNTTENFNQIYMETVVHEAALSAMNVGINRLWKQQLFANKINVITNQCSSHVYTFGQTLDSVKIKAKAWTTVFDEEHYAETGENLYISDSLIALFAYNIPVSRYFWFTNHEQGVYWISGDSVWGPIHTNHVLRTNGSPVFFEKVTAYRGINPNPNHSGSRAHFLGGWEVGIYSALPTDMTAIADAAIAGNGGAPYNTKSIYNLPMSLDFQADGNVIRSVDGGPPDTVAITNIAPTGVIYSSKDVRVKGVMNGELTVYSQDDIWIDDDLVYADDPLANPSSNDLLGLVAGDKVIVSDNSANNNNINIQACIMAASGSFTAENYSGRPVSGTLRITGSIAQNNRGPVGQFNSWSGSITHGFSKRYYYDPRLKTKSPPYYPYIRHLHLISWWE